MMKSQVESYQSIAANDEVEIEQQQQHLDDSVEQLGITKTCNRTGTYSLSMFLALGTLFLTVGVMVAFLPSSTLPASSVDMVLGSSNPSSVAACTFDECRKSSCNHEVAPYTCLFHNGGPHGGCSATPWTPGSCTTQCDLSGCDDLDIPESVKDCNVKCSKDWCSMNRLCGRDTPYQCTSGSSTFGCSTDKYQWTFKTKETSCSSCCMSTSCEE